MASINLGTLYCNSTSSQYGIYDCTIYYDSVTRNGLNVTVNNLRVEMLRRSSKYSTNRIAGCAAIGYAENFVSYNQTLNKSGSASPAKIIYEIGSPTYQTTGTSVYIGVWVASTGSSDKWSNFQGNSPLSLGTYLSCPGATTSINKFIVSKRNGFTGLTSVQVDWSTIDVCDYIWYSTDNGGTWVQVYVNSTWGTFNINGLNPNTTYNFKLRVRRSDSQQTTDSGTYVQSTYNINYITSGDPNVSNGQSLRVTASNPSGSSCQIRLETLIDGTLISRFAKQGTDVTFTVDEINSLLQYCTNNPKFTIRTTADTLNDSGEAKYYSWKNGTYTIINSDPEFSNFTFEDSNESVVNITGNNQILIKNKSVLKVNISADNKMVAKNNATPIRYDISCANRSSSVSYSNSDISSELGTIANTGLVNCIVKAVDSRNFHTDVTKQIQVIDYFTPTMIYSVGRVNNFENNTLIKLNGSFAKVLINDESKNTIQSVKVRYKIADDSSEYSEWQNITFSINTETGTYTCTDKTLVLDNTNTYFVQLLVQDNFESYTETIKISEGIPIMFVNASKKNVGIGKINEHDEYSLDIAGDLYVEKSVDIDGYLNINKNLDVHQDIIASGTLRFTTLVNSAVLGSASTWMPNTLTTMGAKKIFSMNSAEGVSDEGEFGIAYKDTACYPFTDGAFYQGVAGNKVLDESIFVKIWEDSTVTGWHEADLGIDISAYKFLIICTNNMSVFVPTQYLSLNITWCGWLDELQKDVAVNRGIWRNGNDIHWGPAYYYGINSFSGFGQVDNINYPKVIYGIRV